MPTTNHARRPYFGKAVTMQHEYHRDLARLKQVSAFYSIIDFYLTEKSASDRRNDERHN